MEKYCKSCGRVFKDSDFKLCPYCGNQLSTREGRQPIPRKLRHQVFQRDNYRCRECGATNKQTRLHVDHIIPVAKGGTNDLDNLQTLCEKCNRAKYTDEWVGGEIGSEAISSEHLGFQSNIKRNLTKNYYCQNCCTEIPNKEYCPHCGSIRVRKLSESETKIKQSELKIKHKVELKWYCENCCTEIPPNNEYCPHCGSIKVKNPKNKSEYAYLKNVDRYPIWGL